MFLSSAKLFTPYTASKYHGSLAVVFYLVLRKISHFGVLHSFELKKLLRRNIQRTKEYWMYFKNGATP